MNQLQQDLMSGKARIGPDGEPYETTTWATIDLEAAKGDRATDVGPRFLLRADGKALIYAGRPHVFYGPSESLKTWAALLACRSVLDAGLTALYIDFEGDERTFVERARIVGIADDALGTSIGYVRPEEPLKGSKRVIADLMQEETTFHPTLVVLDGVTECYSLHGWDINKATDAAEFQKLFGNFADGTASIAIDHSGKDAGRGVIGSQHKRAGLDPGRVRVHPGSTRGPRRSLRREDRRHEGPPRVHPRDRSERQDRTDARVVVWGGDRPAGFG